MSTDRPILTLRRKSTPPPASSENKPVIASRRKKVIVAVPGRPKYRKKSKVTLPAPAAVPALPESAPQRTSAAPRRPRLMAPDAALSLIRENWPALIDDDGCLPMKVGIREDMFRDITIRGLDVSRKQLRRCLKTITRTEQYTARLIPGAMRYGIGGDAAGKVLSDECR